MELWDVWLAPDGTEVRIRERWPRPPLVRGSEQHSANVSRLAEGIRPEPFGLIPASRAEFSARLEGEGWTYLGTGVWSDEASEHLRAAVENAERSAVLQLQVEEERAKVEPTSPKLIDVITIPSLFDRARRASDTAVILAVACAEAFINQVASEHLEGWGRAEDRMQLGSKWLLVPRLIAGKPVFSRGTEPFQGFAEVVKARNALVHPRPSETFYEGRAGLLRAVLESEQRRDARRGRWACTVVRQMLLAFGNATGIETPDWVAYVPPGGPDELDAWSKANVLTGVRDDPDFPKVGSS